MKHLSLLLFSHLAACGGEYSPWQSKPTHTGITDYNLKWLQTLDNGSSEPFSFMLAGDPQAIPGQMDNVVDRFNSGDATFLAIAGDLTDMGFMKEYELLDRALSKAVKPVLTVVGNHDGLNNSKKIYQEMFGPLNYSFSYRDVTFVMWNNNGYEWSVDLDWLEEQVIAHKQVVVIAHQPPDGGALSASQEERWTAIRQHPSYIASLHGHVHKAYFKRENGKPIYVVDRMHGSAHAIVSFSYGSVTIDRCNPGCERVAE